MKKLLIGLCTVLLLFACNDKAVNNSNELTDTQENKITISHEAVTIATAEQLDVCSGYLDEGDLDALKQYKSLNNLDFNGLNSDKKLLLEITLDQILLQEPAKTDTVEIFEYLVFIGCSLDKVSSNGETIRERISNEGGVLLKGLYGIE